MIDYAIRHSHGVGAPRSANFAGGASHHIGRRGTASVVHRGNEWRVDPHGAHGGVGALEDVAACVAALCVGCIASKTNRSGRVRRRWPAACDWKVAWLVLSPRANVGRHPAVYVIAGHASHQLDYGRDAVAHLWRIQRRITCRAGSNNVRAIHGAQRIVRGVVHVHCHPDAIGKALEKNVSYTGAS